MKLNYLARSAAVKPWNKSDSTFNYWRLAR